MPDPFRDNIPGYSGPPDREAWEQKHGAKPYSVGRVREAHVSRALTAIRKDYSTIDRDQTIGTQVSLESVCERIKADLDVQEESLVFFDPADEQFWIYPCRKP
jgi:hypothetical protein